MGGTQSGGFDQTAQNLSLPPFIFVQPSPHPQAPRTNYLCLLSHIFAGMNLHLFLHQTTKKMVSLHENGLLSRPRSIQ